MHIQKIIWSLQRKQKIRYNNIDLSTPSIAFNITVIIICSKITTVSSAFELALDSLIKISSQRFQFIHACIVSSAFLRLKYDYKLSQGETKGWHSAGAEGNFKLYIDGQFVVVVHTHTHGSSWHICCRVTWGKTPVAHAYSHVLSAFILQSMHGIFISDA